MHMTHLVRPVSISSSVTSSLELSGTSRPRNRDTTLSLRRLPSL